MSDHFLPPSHEKHISDAKIWGIMIIVSAALLLVIGFFVKSVNKETLPELKTSSTGQVGAHVIMAALATRALAPL